MSVTRPVAVPGRLTVGARVAKRLSGGAIYLIVLAIGVVWLIPTLGLFISSLRKASDISGSSSCSPIVPFHLDGAIQISGLQADPDLFSPDADGKSDRTVLSFSSEHWRERPARMAQSGHVGIEACRSDLSPLRAQSWPAGGARAEGDDLSGPLDFANAAPEGAEAGVRGRVTRCSIWRRPTRRPRSIWPPWSRGCQSPSCGGRCPPLQRGPFRMWWRT